MTLRRLTALRDAVRSLNSHRLGPYSSPADCQAAAEAFGTLFSTLGEFAAEYLPPPLDAYGDWLAESGDFFTNMRFGLRPHQGAREDRPYLTDPWQDLRTDQRGVGR
jgi:hypothetical protein